MRGKSAKRTRAEISLKESGGATMGSADWPRLQRPVDRLRDLITADRASAAREQGRKYLQSRKAGLLDKLWSPMILE